MDETNITNPVNEGQSAVVEPNAENAAQTGDVATSASSEVQSSEDNSKFASKRREMDAASKQHAALLEKAKAAGYDSLEAALDAVQKQKNGTETEALEREVIGNKMANDLAKIQRIDPSVASLEDLGEDFEKLVAAGIDPVQAFCAIRQANDSQKEEKPASIGAVGGQTSPTGEYYSEDEINYYESHPEEVTDGILDKLMKSLSRRKK